MTFVSVASRQLSTTLGMITLDISVPTVSDAGGASCGYRVVDASGKTRDEMNFEGVDSIQALIFCLASAGDYIKRFEPGASFVGLPTAGLPLTDLTVADEWVATVRLPLSRTS